MRANNSCNCSSSRASLRCLRCSNSRSGINNSSPCLRVKSRLTLRIDPAQVNRKVGSWNVLTSERYQSSACSTGRSPRARAFKSAELTTLLRLGVTTCSSPCSSRVASRIRTIQIYRPALTSIRSCSLLLTCRKSLLTTPIRRPSRLSRSQANYATVRMSMKMVIDITTLCRRTRQVWS